MRFLKCCLLAVVLCSLTGCVSIDDKWDKALSINTIQGYEAFIEADREGKFLDKAQMKIQALRWENAKSVNTLSAYKEFVRIYPSGDLSKKAGFKIMQLEWERVKKIDSIESYEEFITFYPTSGLVRKARFRLIEKEWEEAVSKDGIESYEAFLKDYPVSQHTINAYQKLLEFYSNLEWEKAKNADSKTAYRAFLIKYPKSRHALAAYQKLEKQPDHALQKFRQAVRAQIKKKQLKDVPVIPVFAVFFTDEPSYFILKKSDGRFYKINDHNVMPYFQAARLPLLCQADPLEGIVLFLNRNDWNNKKMAGYKVGRLLFPQYTFIIKKFRHNYEDYRILWPLGQNAEYVHEALANTLAVQKYSLFPESKPDAVFQTLENTVSQIALNDSDKKRKLLARRIKFFLMLESNRTPNVRIEAQMDFSNNGTTIDCANSDEIDEIKAYIDESIFSLINFYKTENQSPDLLINIKIESEALKAGYGPKLRLYTAAKTKGVIQIEIPDVDSDTEAFKGYQPPQSTVQDTESEISMRKDPCAAPFFNAVKASDFKDALKSALESIIGDNLLKQENSL